MTEKTNYFKELQSVDIGKHVEKKGAFSYLSWAWAVIKLRELYPDATWEVIKNNDGLPYIQSKVGCFVEVAVTVNGITLSQIHPVLDIRNKTVFEPNAFQINTSIQRCLAKAIALHGLGLSLYAGEDITNDGDTSKASQTVYKKEAAVGPKQQSSEEDIFCDECKKKGIESKMWLDKNSGSYYYCSNYRGENGCKHKYYLPKPTAAEKDLLEVFDAKPIDEDVPF